MARIFAKNQHPRFFCGNLVVFFNLGQFPPATAAARKIIAQTPCTCQEENYKKLKKFFLSQNAKKC